MAGSSWKGWSAGLAVAAALVVPAGFLVAKKPTTAETPRPQLHGKFVWHDLLTTEPAAVEKFYGGLFGWTWKASETSEVEYWETYREEQPIGGLLPMKGEWWGEVPPHFMPYFLVADCEAAVRKASELGGGAAVPATEIPHVGKFAVLRDPTGAHFSVIAMAEGAGA